jgi:hypothetical protein
MILDNLAEEVALRGCGEERGMEARWNLKVVVNGL